MTFFSDLTIYQIISGFILVGILLTQVILLVVIAIAKKKEVPLDEKDREILNSIQRREAMTIKRLDKLQETIEKAVADNKETPQPSRSMVMCHLCNREIQSKADYGGSKGDNHFHKDCWGRAEAAERIGKGARTQTKEDAIDELFHGRTHQ